LSNFSKEFNHWLAVSGSEAQQVYRYILLTKVLKIQQISMIASF
jgi:hypothetical protein